MTIPSHCELSRITVNCTLS